MAPSRSRMSVLREISEHKKKREAGTFPPLSL
jgi:hypothetical protein